MDCRFDPRSFRSKEAIMLGVIGVGAAVLGGIGLGVVERELIARAGESLVLGASEVATTLDSQVAERAGDIEILAAASPLRSTDPGVVLSHLRSIQQAYPVYSRLAVVDPSGRTVASTDPDLAGKDLGSLAWFQEARRSPRAYVETGLQRDQEGGFLSAVVFSVQIRGSDGRPRGVIMTEIDRASWEKRVAEIVGRFQGRMQHFGFVRYRVLNSDGEILLTVPDSERPGGNLRSRGLPSAIRVAGGRAGWVEEDHLVRKVPVITGYARMGGERSRDRLQWGVLVRADRHDVLANIRGVLLQLGLVGLAVFLPTFGLLVWSSQCQRMDQNKAEAALCALAENEARTRTVLHNAMDAVVITDARGMISGWNRQAEAVFGWEQVEVLDRSLAATIVPAQYRDAYMQGLARYVTTGETTVLNKRIEMSALRKDGTEFPVELTITPLNLERGPFFSAFIRDISERKKMIDRLREGEAYFRLMSEQLPVGVFEIDEGGKCIYKNKMWDTIMRSSSTDEFGFSSVVLPEGSWIEWVHPDDREQLSKEWKCVRDSFCLLHMECRLPLIDGNLRWVELNLWPMAEDRGFRFLGAVQDITARKETFARAMQLQRRGRFELRTLAEARSLAELLAYAFPDPSRTQLGLMELLANGIEHGNLEISYDEKSSLLEAGRFDEEISRRLELLENRQKRVWVSMDRTAMELEVKIVDEGKGFDWHRYLSLEDERSDESHGRGIAMSKSISFDRLEYRAPGNQVVVSTRLIPADPGAAETNEQQAA